MTQRSKQPLDREIESRMFELFWQSLTRLSSQQETAEFFGDILTATEKLMLVKRYFTAVLLAKGYPPTHVRQTLNVSFTTIATVSAWLKNLKPATKKILDRHLKDKAWGQFFDKIEAVLDTLPPGRYEDWRQAGKAKCRRGLERSARSVLR